MSSRRYAELNALRRAGLLPAATAAALDGRDLNLETGTYAKHSVIFRQGDKPTRLCVLTLGRIELSCITPDGEIAITDLIQPTRSLMLSSVFLDEAYPVQAKCLDEVRVVHMPAETFRRLVNTEHGVAVAAARIAASDQAMSVGQITMLKTETSLQRVCRYILRLGGDANSGAAFKLPFGKREIAGFLGMNPATLSRHLADIRGHGVNVVGSEVQVVDRTRLTSFLGEQHPSAHESGNEPNG